MYSFLGDTFAEENFSENPILYIHLHFFFADEIVFIGVIVSYKTWLKQIPVCHERKKAYYYYEYNSLIFS